MPCTAMSATVLHKTPLHALHLELGAKMVPFAGYEMPVNYPSGILAEHRHCRAGAALFDVSHMGQILLRGNDAARALESLVPMDVIGLSPGRQRYGFFTNPSGGILDDLMITRRENDVFIVVNAARKDADLDYLRTHVGTVCTVEPLSAQALLALQGPAAVAVLARLDPALSTLAFLTGMHTTLGGAQCFVTRSGYTGEDGFEISLAAAQAEAFARMLLETADVRPAGLGARDTLRLEAGLCLYGHDIDAATTPVEAGLGWAIQKVRRAGGARAGRYPGADIIDAQFAHGVGRKRAGLLGLERAPVREGTTLHDAGGKAVGHVTSGTLSPSLERPIAMGYVDAGIGTPGSEVFAQVRGKYLPMRVSALPFTPHRYVRG